MSMDSEASDGKEFRGGYGADPRPVAWRRPSAPRRPFVVGSW